MRASFDMPAEESDFDLKGWRFLRAENRNQVALHLSPPLSNNVVLFSCSSQALRRFECRCSIQGSRARFDNVHFCVRRQHAANEQERSAEVRRL